MSSVADEIFKIFERRGDAAYYGEPVSQTEHALQTAFQAEKDGAPDSLVLAALLHDLGHLLHGLAENIAEQGVDAHHQEASEAWLSQYFGADITEPVKLHVAAKRYLCAVDPDYLNRLSPASLQSLLLQGGPFSDQEAEQFARLTHFRSAVQLRCWDDQAKVPGLKVPPLEHYRSRLEAAATRQTTSSNLIEY
jgi:phosphonate degradation associated HDIG domain protein